MKSIALILLSLLIVFQCFAQEPENIKPKLKFSYKPPFLPIKIVIDSDGNFDIETDELTIVTFLGEFSLSAEVPIKNSDNYASVVIQDTTKNTKKVIAIKDNNNTKNENPKPLNKDPLIIDAPKDNSAKLINIDTSGNVVIEKINAKQAIDEKKNMGPTILTGNWLIDQGVFQHHNFGTPYPDSKSINKQELIKALQNMIREERAKKSIHNQENSPYGSGWK